MNAKKVTAIDTQALQGLDSCLLSWNHAMSSKQRENWTKKGVARIISRLPPKMGTKKGKGVSTALEAPLPVTFYPLDFA
jgi:hypothetical protein